MRRRILSVAFLLVGLVAIGGLMAASLDPVARMAQEQARQPRDGHR
jgi:hypothetical protein